MEGVVNAAVPLRVGKKMRKRRELDALVGGGGRSGRLLSASSDEGEPWARRAGRRRRSRPFLRLAAALALCVCVVSAATVLWLFVDVRRQIVSLHIEMDRVSTSSEGVSDALQLCHTAAKELRANASELSSRLGRLEDEHAELAGKVSRAVAELNVLSEQLSAAPKLADTPRRLAELQLTVASFGSQINGFDSALSSARKQAVAAASGVDEVKTSLSALESRVNETISNSTANSLKSVELGKRIDLVNSTLTQKFNNLRTNFRNLTSSTTTPVPTSTTTPAPTKAPVADVTSQGPTGKPIVTV